MFENIIGQKAAVQTLRQELLQKSFPSAVLFYGPPFTAKLSTALEVARVLTCAESGKWDCSCPACRKQRLLIHPNTLLLGSRYFDIEIAAASDVLRRARTTSANYLFVRAVRKLSRRFDSILWEGEETKIRQVEPALAELEDLLDELSRSTAEKTQVGDRRLDELLDRAVQLSQNLSKQLSSENVPINQLRRSASWFHMTALAGSGLGADGGSTAKIMIIENADKMYDTSSNSLLKLLEEPPPGAFLILLTTRRSALIPTVASRLRPYLFLERRREQEEEVLKRIFHESSEDYGSLREYFLYWKDVNPDQLKTLARRFIKAALDADSEGQEYAAEDELLGEIGELLEPKKPKNARGFVSSFIEEILRQLLVLLREGAMSPFLLKRWNHSIRKHREAFEAYNQQPGLTIESLYYSLRMIR